jgi:hypothetical protein
VLYSLPLAAAFCINLQRKARQVASEVTAFSLWDFGKRLAERALGGLIG